MHNSKYADTDVTGTSSFFVWYYAGRHSFLIPFDNNLSSNASALWFRWAARLLVCRQIIPHHLRNPFLHLRLHFQALKCAPFAFL